jgi:hypothetical protein
MAYCKKCGKRLPARAKFCPNCAAPVSVEVAREAARAPKKWGLAPAGVQLTIGGIIAIIFGLWLKEKMIIQYEEMYGMQIPVGYTSLEPFGWMIIAIGVAVTIFGIWKWSTTFKS